MPIFALLFVRAVAGAVDEAFVTWAAILDAIADPFPMLDIDLEDWDP